MFKDSFLPVGPSPRPGKRTSLLWLEGSLLPGTPRYTPAWEKTGSIVPRALGEEEEWEEFEEEEFEEEWENEERVDELVEYLDNQYF
ncbi:MAG: hypothetical protein QXN17_02495 [Nitrososphaerota archaeon]